jgi:hypothetical protein
MLSVRLRLSEFSGAMTDGPSNSIGSSEHGRPKPALCSRRLTSE